MEKHKSITLTDQISERLETDILSGKYSRGEVLTEVKLSEELGVSRTPVREALRRLAAEHIIEETSKGALVIGIGEEEVRDIFDIRIEIEGEAVKRTAESITESQLEELKETLELQKFYFERQNPENARIMDSRFHELIYDFCGSAVYSQVLTPLHKKILKYRKATFENKGLGETSIREHEEIFNALKERDGEKASRIMTLHVINAKKRILGE